MPMARLRTIKPGFFLDDELAECRPLARLLFAGLWTVADREGRLKDRPRKIKAETLPYDDCDVNELLNELARNGFIVRYEFEGKQFIAVPTWLEHQQPHYKETLSVIPPPPGTTGSGYVATPVSRQQRDRIFDRDGQRCAECGSKSDLGIDHIVPRSLGGDSADENLRVLCRSCNSAKGNRLAKQSSPNVEPTSDRPSIEVAPIPTDSSCLVSCLVSGNHKELLSDSGESNDASLDDFDPFWTPYPRKESKQAARRSWKRVPKKDRAAAAAAAESMRDCVDRGWQEKTFCPHPSTFLNQRRWEDWVDGPPPNYLPDEAKGGNGDGPAVVKRPTCPKCEADLTYDDRQRASCPMCDYKEVPQ